MKPNPPSWAAAAVIAAFPDVSRGASVGRGGGAAGSATASEDPFGCRGGGRFGIEGPVTTSKSAWDMGLTSSLAEAAPHSATFG
jgi:hypothetical protein